MDTKLSTDIFYEQHDLAGRIKILAERVERFKGSSINPDVSVAMNALWQYNAALREARDKYWDAVHCIRGLDHPDYDSLFAGWART